MAPPPEPGAVPAGLAHPEDTVSCSASGSQGPARGHRLQAPHTCQPQSPRCGHRSWVPAGRGRAAEGDVGPPNASTNARPSVSAEDSRVQTGNS